MEIRRRTEDDLPACVSALAQVQATDGYPSAWPDDPVRWLTPRAELAGWVAMDTDGSVLGHVALHQGKDTIADISVATELGVEPEQIGSLARLFTTPAARRRGVAAALIDAVITEAKRLDLRLFLDVVADAHAAVAFYERMGWRRVGTGRSSWRNAAGHTVDLLYFTAP